MAVRIPDETFRTALALASRAPSVHNSQPWQWRVGANSVHLYCDPSMRLSRTDPDGRDLMVSCGAALHHSTVAFAALGWRAVVHRLPNPADPRHLASLELHRTAPTDADIALSAAISRRCSDRRRYTSTDVALGDIALMGARAARFGVTLRRVQVTAEFRALLMRAAALHAHDPDYVGELALWSGTRACDRGVPAHNAPPANPDAAVPDRLFAATALAEPQETAAEGSGVVLALGTAQDDAVSQLRTGEATSAVLLTATAQGLASCILSEALEIPDTRRGLREYAFDDEQYPQMLLRVGWPVADAEPLPLTPRRPLADTVRRLDNSAFI